MLCLEFSRGGGRACCDVWLSCLPEGSTFFVLYFQRKERGAGMGAVQLTNAPCVSEGPCFCCCFVLCLQREERGVAMGTTLLRLSVKRV